jgi:ribosomal protein S15P/S13E
MSSHLQANRKDNASKRSLEAVLNQRRKLLMYLHRTDR